MSGGIAPTGTEDEAALEEPPDGAVVRRATSVYKSEIRSLASSSSLFRVITTPLSLSNSLLRSAISVFLASFYACSWS